MKGIVVSSTGIVVYVRNIDSGEICECSIRGKLRLKGVRSTSPVVVGDVVEYELTDDNYYAISDVMPRENYVIRKSPNLSKESHIIASNIDQAALVLTLFSPKTNREFIDRFTVCCHAYKIPVTLVLNKIDLASTKPEMLQEFRDIYTLAGYPILEVSATTGEGMDSLLDMLKDKVTLLSGNSGVGKSTIIKNIIPESDVRIGEISTYHSKGKHTTTFSKMYALEGQDGYIIDTPGIKGFGLIDVESNELYRYFPDLMKYSSDCQYYNCTHTHEPGCNVVKSIEEGLISISRYESYLKLMDEEKDKYR